MSFLARELLPKSPPFIGLSCIEDASTNDKCCEDLDDNRTDGVTFSSLHSRASDDDLIPFWRSFVFRNLAF